MTQSEFEHPPRLVIENAPHPPPAEIAYFGRQYRKISSENEAPAIYEPSPLH